MEITNNTKLELKKLRGQSEVNAKIFDALQKCMDDDKEIVTENIISVGDFASYKEKKSGLVKLRSEIKSLMTGLTNLGLGKYIVGRLGKQSRFELKKGITANMISEASIHSQIEDPNRENLNDDIDEQNEAAEIDNIANG